MDEAGIREELTAYGWTEEQIQQEIAALHEEHQAALVLYEEQMQHHQVVVWPENRDAVRVFLAIDCDWEKPGAMGGDFRLPTSEIEAAIRLSEIENPADCWARIQLMKRVAAGILREQYRAK